MLFGVVVCTTLNINHKKLRRELSQELRKKILAHLLEQFAHSEEAKISVDRCRGLTESYRNCQVASKGWATKYSFKGTIIFFQVSFIHR